ncbi:MAG: acetylglutamate kinase [Fibrobacterota bacterium]
MSNALIKIGGSTVNAPGFLKSLAHAVEKCRQSYSFCIVHGGGKDIAEEFSRMGKTFEFVEGLRITDGDTVAGVQRVLSGGVNKRIVNSLVSHNVSAAGISGVDAAFLEAEKISAAGRDIGYVGRIARVNPRIITVLQSAGYLPVISPVSSNGRGDILNVNADDAASEIAICLRADDLIYISDVDGVMVDGAVLPRLSVADIEAYIQAGHITGGMIPKLRSAADSIDRGVKRVHICGWYGDETLSRELSRSKQRGTIIHGGDK